MRSPLKKTVAYAMVSLIIFTGCQPGRPFYLHERGDLQYYVDQQVDVRHPDAEVGLLEETTQTLPPRTIRNAEITNFRDMTLEEAVNIALKNTKAIRATGRPVQSGNTIQGIGASIIDNPDAPTMFEIGIRESEPNSLPIPGQISSPELLATNSTLDTNQGVEAALAEFDAHVTSSLFWNTTNRPRNFIFPNLELQDNEASDVSYQTTLSKKSATGTVSTLRTAADFNSNNNVLGLNQTLESAYTARLEFEINQPLLRGNGVAVNRTPILVARIGGDQTVANTEFFLQNMLTQIEISYWGLYNAYRQFEVAKESVDNAIKVYNIEKDNFEIGGSQRSTKATVSRAAAQYYSFVRNLKTSYAELMRREADFRFMLGLASNDGAFIRPIDEPITSEVAFDWDESLFEAIVYRPNLRIKRWEIKKKELGVSYAKNGLLGQLNFVFLYRALGLGDELLGGDGVDFPNPDSGAVDNLFAGQHHEIQMGLQGGYTVGHRREMLNVRNAQLKLARERARLEDMELNVSHELSKAMDTLIEHYETAAVNANEWLASHEEVKTYADLRDQGIDITNVLEAQRNEAQARIAFHNSITNYNQFIALIHRIKGTTLQYYNVQFGEGPWPEKAYDDAAELARKRSASRPMNYGFTRPGTVSVGTDPTIYDDIPPYTIDPSYSEEVIIDNGTLIEEIDGDLQPIEQLEEIVPKRNATPPSPETIQPSNSRPSPLNTTSMPSAKTILRASYLEEERPRADQVNIQWDELGLEEEKPGPQIKTRASLKSID